MISRQQLASINRWLGWIAVPITFLAFYTRYVDNWGPKAIQDVTKNSLYTWINILVGILPLVHAVISLFVFGIPRFARTQPKIVHIWIGYIVLLVILVSQSLAGTGIVYDVATIAMYLIIAVHTVLGFRFMLARRGKGDTMEELHRANRKAAATSQQA